MIEEVKEKVVKMYHEQKLAHAYLFVTNNIDKAMLDIIDIIKQIFCPEKFSHDCNNCNICNLINQLYLPSLVIITPDGKTIKKEQILDLKKQFSTKPIYTKENIYIIKNAECLNASSANTMLKFLEEPEEDIIGFFLTNNVNNVINTIKSRCEIINMFYSEAALTINTLDNENNYKYFEVAIEYLRKIEVEKKDGIMYNNSDLLNIFSEREDIKIVFQILVLIFEELLKYKYNLDNQFAILNLGFLVNLDEKVILKKINLLNEFLDNLNSNANLELLLDRFVIEMS